MKIALFDNLWQPALFLLVCLFLFIPAILSFRLVNKGINIGRELTETDNRAFYFAYIGYFLGLLTMMSGVLNSEGTGRFWQELLLTFIYGLIGIACLHLVSWMTNRLFHRSIDTWKAIADEKNMAVGIMKGAGYLSLGIIIAGVLLTEVNKPLEAFAFLLFALAFASIGFWYYNLITPFRVSQEIYKGNAAVACASAGAQIGFAILIYSGFQIDHVNWVQSLERISIDVLAGLIFLPLVRIVVDKLFIFSNNLNDELVNQEEPNIGAGLFEAAAYIGAALLFVWCWNI